MLKKSLSSLAITASLVGLAGCDISSTTANSGAKPELQKQQEAYLASITYPVFDAVNSRLPLGIDLIFADAGDTDGTANVGATGGNPVFDAINDLDGGISTLAPIDIAISGGIDPDSVVAGGNVHLVRLPNAADIDPNDLILPTVGDVTSAADVDALDITTLSPFFAQTKADGTAADDSAFAAGMGLPESVAALNLYGANDGVPLSQASPNQTDGIIAKQPVAGTDYDVTVISLDGGINNTIRISPKVPLDPKTKYIVAVTDGITNAAGEKIKPSPDYSVIRASTDAAGELTAEASKLASSALVGVSKAINGWELLASTIVTQGSPANAANLGGNIVFTSALTTGDPKTVLTFMANPDIWTNAAASAAAGSAVDVVTGNAALIGLLSTVKPTERTFELIKNAGGAGVHQIPVAMLTDDPDTEEFDPSLSDNVLISQGAIQLPQYTESLTTDSGDIWSANTTLGAALDPSGDTPPTDTDGSANVTYRYPIAEKKRDVVVPVMMFEPIPTDVATGLADTDGIDDTTAETYESTGPGGAGCGASQPGAGWPVVIIQHGFTSERTGNLINGSKVADLTCSVVIAMDLPHHGIAANSSRLGLGVDYVETGSESSYPWAYAKSVAVAAAEAAVADESNPDALTDTILDSLAERHENLYLTSTGAVAPMDFDNATGGSGSLWIRLDNFQRTRDNMRQGVMDLLNLNATLGAIDVDGNDSADLDTTNVTYIGHSLGGIIGTTFVAINNLSVNGYANANLNQIDRAVLATPGGHLTKLIENSVALSGQVLAGLEGSSPLLVQGNSSLESYMKVLQATIDSADPMNFIANLKDGSATSDIPVLVVGMYGNGSTNPSDLVVPVNGLGPVLANGSAQAETARSPLVGLDPMLELLGAENVKDGLTDNKIVAKYQVGGHGTFSSAGTDTSANGFDSEDAFAEMLSQTVQLILTDTVATADADSVLKTDVE